MSHKVKTLVRGLSLPDGNLYPNANTIVTLTDAQFLQINSLVFSSGYLQDLGLVDEPLAAINGVVALGNVTGAIQLDLSLGSIFTCTVTGNVVFSFTNWPTGLVAVEPIVIATQDGVGHSISFTGVTWLPAGSPPLFQTGASQTNVTSFFSANNGTTVYGQGGSTLGGGFGVYGDGSDGAVVLDGVNTYSFLGKSGNTYWLLRDTYFSSLTIAAGISLQLGGGGTATFRAFCKGTLSIAATAFIITAVNNGSSGATGGSNLATGSLTPGANGPAGGTGVGAAGTNVLGQSGGFAGAGGASGGTAGGLNGVSALTAGYSLPHALPWASLMAAIGGNVSGGLQFFPGGASGGAGAGDGTNSGGGGGAGGNPLFLAAQNLVNNGTIKATGGNGAQGTAGNVGGGGGGQGGPVMVIYGSYSGSGAIQSVGGNGGALRGTGAAGASGGSGWIVQLVN